MGGLGMRPGFMGGLGMRPGCDGWPGNEARVRWVVWE